MVILDYTMVMKTAISIPDTIYEQADEMASELRLSRSKLYCMAIKEFIVRHKKPAITEQINQFIDEHGQPTDSVFLHGSLEDLKKVEW